jgi:hypothetical protein
MQTEITPITGNFGGGFPDGVTISQTVLSSALATPGAIKTGTSGSDTVLLQAYDVDGAAYKTFATLTANNTPTMAITAPSGGTLAINATTIGATTAGSGAFTTLTASSTLGVTGVTTLADDLVGGASTDILINTNKFTVAASSGNTVVAGTLGVAGLLTASAAATVGTTLGVTGNMTTSAYHLHSVDNALTAVGTNRATALQLAKERNIVSSAAAGTGVVLPVGVIGMEVMVFNNGANLIQVYASASETIDGTAGSTGVALTNALRAVYVFNAANTWVSAQLGAVSA